MSESNLEELLLSPYDDDRPTDEVPWKLPVGAAIVGALAMAVFVIFSIVTAPDEDIEGATTAVPPREVAPVEATGFPPGYAEVSDDVAMRVDVMRMDGDSTTLFVSSVVKAGSAPESVSAVDVASWTIRSIGSEPSMRSQHASRMALGRVTVELSPIFNPQNAVVVATLPGTVDHSEDVLVLPPEVPTVVTDHRISVGDAAVIIEELEIANGFGSIRWHVQGGLAARLDVVVTFDGVEFPLALVTPYHSSESDFGVGHLPPPWNPVGATTLLPDGEPLSGANVPRGITVTFNVSVVTEAGEDIEIPIGSFVQK